MAESAGMPRPSCMIGNFTIRNRLDREIQLVGLGGGIAADESALAQFLNVAVFEPLHVDPTQHPVLLVVSCHSVRFSFILLQK